MRLTTLFSALLAASLAAACGQAPPDTSGDAGTAGRVAVETEACGDDCMDCSLGLDLDAAADGSAANGAATAAEPGPAAELVTVRLAVMGMG